MKQWLQNKYIRYCEELSDLIVPSDTGKVFSVYLCAESHFKAIKYFIHHKEYNKIVPYASSVGL